MGTKKKKKAAESEAPVAVAEPATETRDAGDKDLTLLQLAEKWAAHLDRAGAATATIDSYKNDLRVALAHFGEDREAASITAAEVAKYYDSDAVLKLKSGKPKSQISIDKTRRILRLAFEWAAHAGLVPASPVPAFERKRKAASDDGEKPATAKPKRARKA